MTDVYNQTDLEVLAADCLTRAGLHEAVARTVARDFALSEAAGDGEHGIAALLRDIRLLRYGRIFVDARVTVSRPAAAIINIDGGHGFAAAALAKGMPALVEATGTQGMAMVHLSRASDAGMMAGTLADLAEAGLAGVALRGGGDAVAIGPGSSRAVRLNAGTRSSLQDLLALAPPPADAPMGGPIALSGWLCAVDPVATGIGSMFDQLPIANIAARTNAIAVAPDLLAQIVNA